VEKYGRIRQATEYYIILYMRVMCRITKTPDTNLEYVTLLIFHGKNKYVNAS